MFRPPMMCDSCVHKLPPEAVFDYSDKCMAYPDGIPTEMFMGGQHLAVNEDQEGEYVYQQKPEGESALRSYFRHWFTINDGWDMEEGATGILRPERP